MKIKHFVFATIISFVSMITTSCNKNSQEDDNLILVYLNATNEGTFEDGNNFHLIRTKYGTKFSSLEIPIPTYTDPKECLIFNGWYEFGTTSDELISDFTITNNINLVASYSKDVTLERKLTFTDEKNAIKINGTSPEVFEDKVYPYEQKRYFISFDTNQYILDKKCVSVTSGIASFQIDGKSLIVNINKANSSDVVININLFEKKDIYIECAGCAFNNCETGNLYKCFGFAKELKETYLFKCDDYHQFTDKSIETTDSFFKGEFVLSTDKKEATLQIEEIRDGTLIHIEAFPTVDTTKIHFTNLEVGNYMPIINKDFNLVKNKKNRLLIKGLSGARFAPMVLSDFKNKLCESNAYNSVSIENATFDINKDFKAHYEENYDISYLELDITPSGSGEVNCAINTGNALFLFHMKNKELCDPFRFNFANGSTIELNSQYLTSTTIGFNIASLWLQDKFYINFYFDYSYYDCYLGCDTFLDGNSINIEGCRRDGEKIARQQIQTKLTSTSNIISCDIYVKHHE